MPQNDNIELNNFFYFDIRINASIVYHHRRIYCTYKTLRLSSYDTYN